MTLHAIPVLVLIAFLYRTPIKLNKKPFLFSLSVIAVYWFQPNIPIRNVAYWLPTISLLVIILCWISVTGREKVLSSVNGLYIFLAILLIIGVSATQNINLHLRLFNYRPAELSPVTIILILLIILGFTQLPMDHIKIWAGLIVVIGIFILIKTPVFSLYISKILRGINHQPTATAASTDLQWIGFSYISFRLIHTLRDKQLGRYADVPFCDYLIFILFPSAIVAGPIDRVDRFTSDLNNKDFVEQHHIHEPFKRITIGLFKKYLVADLLSGISLNSYNGLLVKTPGWMWFLLCAYSFQIYFDFSGYTDIAIGIGEMMGIQLPENFNQPYLQPNLTLFWNSWHMSLTNWFRIYFFNPLTRHLRTRHRSLSPLWIKTLGQFSTMLLIGLWHGIQPGFIIWGVWHATGLFINNLWHSWFGIKYLERSSISWVPLVARVLGICLTFTFVSLGWVWFTITDPKIAFVIIKRLFGFW